MIEQWVPCNYINSQQECTLPISFSNTGYAYLPYLKDTNYSDKGRSFGYNLKSIDVSKIVIQVNFINAAGQTINSNANTSIFCKGY